jgi:hypothetical protein
MRFIEIICISIGVCVCVLGIYELARGGLRERDMECLERLHFC